MINAMNYPKPIMTITEMTKMGFSKTDLYIAAHHFLAYKYIIPSAKNGKFRFDTAEFDKVRRTVLRKD